MDKSFSPEVDYNPAVRLALNADVEPKIEIEALWYDMYDEVFLVHIIDTDGMMREEILQGTFVFSCFRAVERGIQRWV